MLGSRSHFKCPLKALGTSSAGKLGPAFQVEILYLQRFSLYQGSQKSEVRQASKQTHGISEHDPVSELCMTLWAPDCDEARGWLETSKEMR